MVLEIYSQPLVKRFRSNVLSLAMCFQIFISVLLVVIPLVVAYRSYGFYIKESTYDEIPYRYFSYKMLLKLETDTNPITWSTIDNYNNLQGSSLRIPMVSVTEGDDSDNDKLNLLIEMPLNGEKIYGVQLLLFYSYDFYEFMRLSTDPLIIIQHSTHNAASAFNLIGDIEMRQKLPVRGINYGTDAGILDTSSTNIDDFELTTIFEKYQKRNIKVGFSSSFPTWKTSPQATTFKINVTLNHLETAIRVVPGFWYIIKWAWIQFVAIAFVFYYIFESIRSFVFENQAVRTQVQTPACSCVTKKVL